jgi:hypothetical protein
MKCQLYALFVLYAAVGLVPELVLELIPSFAFWVEVLGMV